MMEDAPRRAYQLDHHIICVCWKGQPLCLGGDFNSRLLTTLTWLATMMRVQPHMQTTRRLNAAGIAADRKTASPVGRLGYMGRCGNKLSPDFETEGVHSTRIYPAFDGEPIVVDGEWR
jgi:hypothetical protein